MQPVGATPYPARVTFGCNPNSNARNTAGHTPNSKMAKEINKINSKMAVARDDLGRAARKRGIEGEVTTIRHFGIRCI